MPISDQELLTRAQNATKEVQRIAESREDWRLMGWVGAALRTSQGNVFTGVNIHLLCGMGICAEYSAVADMIKHGETIVDTIVAITTGGSIVLGFAKVRPPNMSNPLKSHCRVAETACSADPNCSFPGMIVKRLNWSERR